MGTQWCQPRDREGLPRRCPSGDPSDGGSPRASRRSPRQATGLRTGQMGVQTIAQPKPQPAPTRGGDEGWAAEQPGETRQQAHPHVSRCTAGRQLPRLLQDCPGRRGRQTERRMGARPIHQEGHTQQTGPDHSQQPRARPLCKTQGPWEGGESNTLLDLCCSQGPASRRRSVMRRCCCCSVASVVSDSVRPHQAPPSLGFSRQEHWSGLPFPPAMHESEK